jgi:hypothetical protein
MLSSPGTQLLYLMQARALQALVLWGWLLATTYASKRRLPAPPPPHPHSIAPPPWYEKSQHAGLIQVRAGACYLLPCIQARTVTASHAPRHEHGACAGCGVQVGEHQYIKMPGKDPEGLGDWLPQDLALKQQVGKQSPSPLPPLLHPHQG